MPGRNNSADVVVCEHFSCGTHGARFIFKDILPQKV